MLLYSPLFLMSVRRAGCLSGKQHPLVFPCMPDEAEPCDSSEFKNESILGEFKMWHMLFLFVLVSFVSRDL